MWRALCGGHHVEGNMWRAPCGGHSLCTWRAICNSIATLLTNQNAQIRTADSLLDWRYSVELGLLQTVTQDVF